MKLRIIIIIILTYIRGRVLCSDQSDCSLPHGQELHAVKVSIIEQSQNAALTLLFLLRVAMRERPSWKLLLRHYIVECYIATYVVPKVVELLQA